MNKLYIFSDKGIRQRCQHIRFTWKTTFLALYGLIAVSSSDYNSFYFILFIHFIFSTIFLVALRSLSKFMQI